MLVVMASRLSLESHARGSWVACPHQVHALSLLVCFAGKEGQGIRAAALPELAPGWQQAL